MDPKIDTGYQYAESFQHGEVGYLDCVELYLGATSAGTTATVSIWSGDKLGTPSKMLESTTCAVDTTAAWHTIDFSSSGIKFGIKKVYHAIVFEVDSACTALGSLKDVYKVGRTWTAQSGSPKWAQWDKAADLGFRTWVNSDPSGVIPEPATMLLFSAALITLGVRTLKRRRIR